MRALIAFDKFKDSMTAHEACTIASNAIAKVQPEWEITQCPLADGGEGFCKILTEAHSGTFETYPDIQGPQLQSQEALVGYVDCAKLPQSIRERLRLSSFGQLAIIEMAQASGLESVPKDKRDPWIASTYGTGQLIAKAAERSVQAILLGVGGSATNDLGLGALEAIGLELLNKNNENITKAVPRDWEFFQKYSGDIWPHIPAISIACDVENPLIGPIGATRSFGPQKGLKPEDMNVFEKLQGTLAKQLCRFFEKPDTYLSEKGAGAAGGIAFGLRVACDAELTSGFSLVEQWLKLDSKIRQADVIITGEGRFDASSLSGKGPGSIFSTAKKRGKQAYVFAGSVDKSLATGSQNIHAISPENMPLDEALSKANDLLEECVRDTLK